MGNSKRDCDADGVMTPTTPLQDVEIIEKGTIRVKALLASLQTCSVLGIGSAGNAILGHVFQLMSVPTDTLVTFENFYDGLGNIFDLEVQKESAQQVFDIFNVAENGSFDFANWLNGLDKICTEMVW